MIGYFESDITQSNNQCCECLGARIEEGDGWPEDASDVRSHDLWY